MAELARWGWAFRLGILKTAPKIWSTADDFQSTCTDLPLGPHSTADNVRVVTNLLATHGDTELWGIKPCTQVPAAVKDAAGTRLGSETPKPELFSSVPLFPTKSHSTINEPTEKEEGIGLGWMEQKPSLCWRNFHS